MVGLTESLEKGNVALSQRDGAGWDVQRLCVRCQIVTLKVDMRRQMATASLVATKAATRLCTLGKDRLRCEVVVMAHNVCEVGMGLEPNVWQLCDSGAIIDWAALRVDVQS